MNEYIFIAKCTSDESVVIRHHRDIHYIFSEGEAMSSIENPLMEPRNWWSWDGDDG